MDFYLYLYFLSLYFSSEGSIVYGDLIIFVPFFLGVFFVKALFNEPSGAFASWLYLKKKIIVSLQLVYLYENQGDFFMQTSFLRMYTGQSI